MIFGLGGRSTHDDVPQDKFVLERLGVKQVLPANTVATDSPVITCRITFLSVTQHSGQGWHLVTP